MICWEFDDIQQRGGVTKTFIEKIWTGLKLADDNKEKKMKDFKGLEFRDPLVLSEVYGVFLKEYGN